MRFVNSFLVGKSSTLDAVITFCAVYLIYLLPLILIFLWFKYKHRRLEIFLSFVACLVAWLAITKFIVPNFIWFRPRPDLVALGAKELLFHRPDYSFPSDHATALFALTFGFYTFGWRKVGNYFLAYTLIISFFRIAIGVHFPLDILAGAFSGLLGVALLYVMREKVKKYIFPIVEAIFKKLNL